MAAPTSGDNKLIAEVERALRRRFLQRGDNVVALRDIDIEDGTILSGATGVVLEQKHSQCVTIRWDRDWGTTVVHRRAVKKR